jgi:hypothetical protein
LVLGFITEVYQVTQSWIYCSWICLCIQDRETGGGEVGVSVVAVLVRRSAWSFLGMAVCPGTQWRVTDVSREWREVATVCMDLALILFD